MRNAYVLARRQAGMSDAEANDAWDQLMASECYENDTYFVQLDRNPKGRFLEAYTVYALIISRHDELPIDDWRDLQEIKNRFVGRETEAVELFPSRSRSFDYQNRTVLFCFIAHREALNPRFPFGSQKRVTDSRSLFPFCMQRPFSANHLTQKELTREAS